MTQTPGAEDTGKVTKALRDKIFRLSPGEINVSPSEDYPHVWGIVMETGFPEGVATLVSLIDGTVSLYFSGGGGVIGAGEHGNVRTAATTFLRAAERYRQSLVRTTEYPMPGAGRVRFYVLTYEGILADDVEENTLGDGVHALSPLFYAGHEVLSEIRKLSHS